MDFLSVGEMVIDFLPGNEAGVYIRKAGGAPANVAIALARQGCDAAFCGMMGNDDFGRFLLETLRDNGVKPLVTDLTNDAITTMAFVTLNEFGDRSFTFARKPGADMFLNRSHIKDEYLDNTSIVHAGSCSLSKGDAVGATVYALQEG
ncbi:MAG: PfkB family carbohydrate kinase, partial [Oscillospiraceae bacterium]